MSSKNVKFSKDSDTSGSRTSSHVSSHASSHGSHKSSRGHRRSDSESLSDYDTRGPVPEGAFSSSDYAQQQLRKAVHSACAERDIWKAKAEELDEHLNHTKKELNQLEARWRGIFERNEVIEAEKKKLLSEKKALQEDKKDLLDENAQLKERLERLEKKLNRASGPPSSSSSNPVQNNPDKANAKIHRSNSRSQRDAPRERAFSEAEQAEKDKARWSKRFERSDESSDGRSDGTSKTERRRRRESTTYIEPMGPPAARPAAPVPPSPTRHYPTYTTSPAYAPQYASSREPVMSSVPRSVKSPSKHPAVIHPSVLVQSPYDSPFHPDEDGGYFPHPLPRDRGR
ncbi:hypothetical protein CONLIGDRAFT_424740 [Coniochaeta ligniaria NRRL 30616]|uniref:Uncharacterized protein n=1 Tax=Coniochaeta ligniaria NRRL 30616 TaxID=1408157 RepID=A0A1J7J1Y4_9PEZI|nr:hypothetical protein CONLIGDRAFT_424740 [Coniochaeta ligniaria NRRL 30616]